MFAEMIKSMKMSWKYQIPEILKCTISVVLKLYQASESLGGLVKPRSHGSHPQKSVVKLGNLHSQQVSR